MTSSLVPSTTDLPALDSRWRLTQPVERFPHFIAPAGATGTIASSDEYVIGLRLDDPPAGSEEWDGEVLWSSNDRGAHAVDFLADCEAI